ncbi:hypothetical protein D3C87_1067130 [compost metagenome]
MRAGAAQGRIAVGHGKSHAFHRAVGQFRTAVFRRQAKEHAARGSVVVRRALAAQIRQEDGRRARLDVFRQADQFADVARLRQPRHPAEAGRGAEDHAHLVPALGQAVAERVHALARIRCKAVAAGKQHAGRPQRQQAGARLYHAQADSGRRIVARAAGQQHRVRNAPFLAQRGAYLRRGGAAFDQARHVLARQTGGGQHALGPVAFGHVQPQSAGSVGHVGDILARQAQGHVILGQQDLGRGAEQRWLVFLQPQQLGRREAGHGLVARDGARLGHQRLEFHAFGKGARVVPQDGCAQHVLLLVEQGGAMHLARQRDAAQAGKRYRLGGADGGDDVQGGVPPVFGILFRPAGMGAGHAQGHAGAGNDGLRVIGEDGLDFGSADIDTEISHLIPE